MSPARLHVPEPKSVSFVELFFDLVFVFAVTQVTVLTVGGASTSSEPLSTTGHGVWRWAGASVVALAVVLAGTTVGVEGRTWLWGAAVVGDLPPRRSPGGATCGTSTPPTSSSATGSSSSSPWVSR